MQDTLRSTCSVVDDVCFSCYRVVSATWTKEESSRSVQGQLDNGVAGQSRQNIRTWCCHLETTQGEGERSWQSSVRTGERLMNWTLLIVILYWQIKVLVCFLTFASNWSVVDSFSCWLESFRQVVTVDRDRMRNLLKSSIPEWWKKWKSYP